jgi:hypothetical protein
MVLSKLNYGLSIASLNSTSFYFSSKLLILVKKVSRVRVKVNIVDCTLCAL